MRVYGTITGRASGHGGGGGAQAGEGSGGEGHQGVGSTQIEGNPPDLLHHLRRRHARRRLSADEATRPEALREEVHDVSAGLLRRRHRHSPCQGSC